MDSISKQKARVITVNAVKKGLIKREPCEVCGDIKSHGHHEDYSKPLEIMWLCHEHHADRHRWLKKRAFTESLSMFLHPRDPNQLNLPFDSYVPN